MGEALGVHEHSVVLLGYGVAAVVRRGRNVVDDDESGGGLLLEPLAGVACIDRRLAPPAPER